MSEEEFPNPDCIKGTCDKCQNNLQTKYEPMLKEHGSMNLKFVQWEQRYETYKNPKGESVKKKAWLQVGHTDCLKNIFGGICSEQNTFIEHIFRNDYQYRQHQNMAKSLPENHAIVYADFSQNYALEANDEIQTTHYVKRQVTLHTMYLIRHSKNSTPEKKN